MVVTFGSTFFSSLMVLVPRFSLIFILLVDVAGFLDVSTWLIAWMRSVWITCLALTKVGATFVFFYDGLLINNL